MSTREDVAVSALDLVVRHRTWEAGVPRRAATLTARTIGLDETVVLGREDGRPGARNGFVAWPAGPAYDAVSREALKITLHLHSLETRLGGAFRGSRYAAEPVTVRIGEADVTATLAEARSVETPVRGPRPIVIEIDRAAEPDWRETLTLEFRVATRGAVGRATVPAPSPAQRRARTALREAWWDRIADAPAGRLVRAGLDLVLEERTPGDTDPEEARRVLRAAVKNPDRLREHVARAVERLLATPDDVPEQDWRDHLAAFRLAQVHEQAADGLGRTDLFLELCRRLARVGLIE